MEKITVVLLYDIHPVLFPWKVLFGFSLSGLGNNDSLSGSVGCQHIPHREQRIPKL